MRPNSVRRVLASSVRPLSHSLTPQYAQLIPRRWKSGPFGYTQAKALVYSKYGEPADVLSLHTHSISPSLSPSTLLLRTLATPINPADINQIQGTYPSRPPMSPLLGTPLPAAIPGNEGCFEILSLGPDIPASLSLSVGDWVIPKATNFGTYRTHAVTPASSILKIPQQDREGLNAIQVGTVSVNPITAYRMLKDFVALGEGDWVIQNGANSGVGRAVVQFCKLWGFRSINVVRERNTPEETEKLMNELYELGATKVVTEKAIIDRGFGEEVKSWIGASQIKLGLNCVGGKATTSLVRHLSEGGHLVSYGAMAKQPLNLPTGLLIFKDIKFSGFWVSRWGNQFAEEKLGTIKEVLALMREGRFKDVPVEKVTWDWETKEEVLKEAVQGTLKGFRAGKGVLVFGDT